MNDDASIQQCVYCGAGGKLTRDHVPPKGIFPKPRPSNLVVIPACSKCNQGNSKDDEYFRLALNVREELSSHPAVQKGQPAVLRSLLDANKPGMRQSFLNNIRFVEQVTPSGIFIKNQFALQTDTNRLRNVVKRTMRGLFYYHKKHRLPEMYDVLVCDEENFVQWPDSERAKFDPIINALKGQNPVTIGEGVFSYCFGYNRDDPDSTYWIFTFYERASYLGLTLPPLPAN
jgi:hypothetical protein